MKNIFKNLIYFIFCFLICYLIDITTDSNLLSVVFYSIVLLIVIKDIFYLKKVKGKKSILMFFGDTIVISQFFLKPIDNYTRLILLIAYISSLGFLLYLIHMNRELKESNNEKITFKSFLLYSTLFWIFCFLYFFSKLNMENYLAIGIFFTCFVFVVVLSSTLYYFFNGKSFKAIDRTKFYDVKFFLFIILILVLILFSIIFTPIKRITF